MQKILRSCLVLKVTRRNVFIPFFPRVFPISPGNAIPRRGILSQDSVEATVIFILFLCGFGRRIVGSLSGGRSARLHSGAACAFV